ncbi:hypothetical protein ACVGVM_20905 [Pseudonocardia bannensis]|uniref:Uncharacterized protein n=1 Tax=Pseudonocardia bannensis TaxID=630973 RepID=A0A848DIB4_9PSEU|nr:hypothetical protein [Pseudonocardia bannensis]NMH92437.1 hypothetical protein [Pseudonocardia bannensis]
MDDAEGTPAADSASVLLAAADTLERLADRATAGRWAVGGLLATRPEVIAHREDGSTEHVAEARAASAGWIVTLSPQTAPHLVRWLRATAGADRIDPAAVAFAEKVLAAAGGR